MNFYHAKTLEQILELEDLAREALSESRYKAAAFSPNKFKKHATEAANGPRHHGVLVAAHGGKPVGFVYCNVGEPLVGDGLLITSVQLLFVVPYIRETLLGGKAFLGLLNGLMAWSNSRKGCEVLIHATSGLGTSEVSGALNRLGFRTCGMSFIK